MNKQTDNQSNKHRKQANTNKQSTNTSARDLFRVFILAEPFLLQAQTLSRNRRELNVSQRVVISQSNSRRFSDNQSKPVKLEATPRGWVSKEIWILLFFAKSFLNVWPWCVCVCVCVCVRADWKHVTSVSNMNYRCDFCLMCIFLCIYLYSLLILLFVFVFAFIFVFVFVFVFVFALVVLLFCSGWSLELGCHKHAQHELKVRFCLLFILLFLLFTFVSLAFVFVFVFCFCSCCCVVLQRVISRIGMSQACPTWIAGTFKLVVHFAFAFVCFCFSCFCFCFCFCYCCVVLQRVISRIGMSQACPTWIAGTF